MAKRELAHDEHILLQCELCSIIIDRLSFLEIIFDIFLRLVAADLLYVEKDLWKKVK